MKYIHTIIITVLLATTLTSQDKGRERNSENRQEKIESRIESQKIAFITQKLELSPNEAQLFWPIYNEYQSKMKEMRQQNTDRWDIDEVSDADADGILNSLLSKEQNELDIKKQYLNKLKTVVPTRKVAQLYIIEQEFRQEILAKIRNRIGKKKYKSKRGNDGF